MFSFAKVKSLSNGYSKFKILGTIEFLIERIPKADSRAPAAQKVCPTCPLGAVITAFFNCDTSILGFFSSFYSLGHHSSNA